MAFVRERAMSDGEVAVFWDFLTGTAKKVTLKEGEPYAPHYPSSDSVVIFAGGDTDGKADEQIAKWTREHGGWIQLDDTIAGKRLDYPGDFVLLRGRINGRQTTDTIPVSRRALVAALELPVTKLRQED